MAEKDDKSEKQTRTSVGIGGTEVERETRSRDEGYRGRDRYDEYDEGDDYQERARRGARDLGESVRDAGRTVRRESTDIITAGCDLIGGFFIGIGEAISPRRRGGSSRGGSSSCLCNTSGGYDDDYDTRESGRYSRPRDRSEGARVSSSRTEIRRTTAR
jgi:hypothetical protein